MEWIDALNRALKYVEAHLCNDIDINELSRAAHYSNFYLQRAFAMMTGMTLAEYIRARRLSLAGQELQISGAKVIDVALKYGYDTPESFQKAFRRFHGITPSAAKSTRAQLRYLNPLTLQLTLKGGSIMDYSVETIGELYVMGMERRFNYDSAFSHIPDFWTEYYAKGYNKAVPGFVGACFDDDGSDFGYLIGCFCDKDDAAPKGYVKHSLGARTWLKFKAIGAIPEALQKLNRQIYTEWLPGNTEYDLGAPLNLEIYSEGDMKSPDYESEIWLPVKKK